RFADCTVLRVVFDSDRGDMLGEVLDVIDVGVAGHIVDCEEGGHRVARYELLVGPGGERRLGAVGKESRSVVLLNLTQFADGGATYRSQGHPYRNRRHHHNWPQPGPFERVHTNLNSRNCRAFPRVSLNTYGHCRS